MPRNSEGVYQKAEPSFVTGTTISSDAVNSVIDDFVTDANAIRPVVAGGTGGNSVATAQAALGVAQKQSSVGDSTAGRGMLVGAFGLGSSAFTIDDFADVNDDLTHFVRTAAVATPDAPTTADEWVGINIAKNTGDAVTLLAGVDTYNLKLRILTDSTWGAWVDVPLIYDEDTVANGHFVKYSNGLMVCRKQFFEAPYNATTDCFGTWTFPAAFNSTTNLSVTAQITPASVGANTTTITNRANLGPPMTSVMSTTQATVRVHRITGTTDFAPGNIIYLSLRAEGTWR